MIYWSLRLALPQESIVKIVDIFPKKNQEKQGQRYSKKSTYLGKLFGRVSQRRCEDYFQLAATVSKGNLLQVEVKPKLS